MDDKPPSTLHLANVQAQTRVGVERSSWPVTCSSYAWDGKMSEMCTGMTLIGPAEKPSTVLKAATSPAVTKNTAILRGDFRANSPIRFKYTSCINAAALHLMSCCLVCALSTSTLYQLLQLCDVHDTGRWQKSQVGVQRCQKP